MYIEFNTPSKKIISKPDIPKNINSKEQTPISFGKSCINDENINITNIKEESASIKNYFPQNDNIYSKNDKNIIESGHFFKIKINPKKTKQFIKPDNIYLKKTLFNQLKTNGNENSQKIKKKVNLTFCANRNKLLDKNFLTEKLGLCKKSKKLIIESKNLKNSYIKFFNRYKTAKTKSTSNENNNNSNVNKLKNKNIFVKNRIKNKSIDFTQSNILSSIRVKKSINKKGNLTHQNKINDEAVSFGCSSFRLYDENNSISLHHNRNNNKNLIKAKGKVKNLKEVIHNFVENQQKLHL